MLNKGAHMKTAAITILSCLLLAGSATAQQSTPGNAAKPVGTSGTSDPTTTMAVSTANDYRLVAGDKLRIEVYKDAQLSQSLQIRPDGKVTLPLIGDVVAAGRTSVELRDAISNALVEYIAKPVVTVMVVETTPQVIYVTGEVNRPGPVPMTGGHMSILQALSVAGGFTDFANKKDIQILRKGASGMQKLKFNYKDALEDDNKREPLQLQAGDTVVVK
jgi:polysaccharide biosynthesis/export protein